MSKVAKLTKRNSNSNAGSSASIDSDSRKELLFKMSKKIAQLTKVIYYLNTRNEDNSIEIKFLKQTYEKELADTLEDGKMLINEMQLKLTAAEGQIASQQEIIKTNLKTIGEKDEEVKAVQEKLVRLEKLYVDIYVRANERKAAASKIIADSNNSLLNVQEKLTDAARKELVEEIEKLNQKHEEYVNTLKNEHFLQLQDAIDQNKAVEKELRDNIAELQGKVDEETQKRIAEITVLRSAYEKREEDLKTESESILSRMRDNLEIESRKVVERDNTILDLEERLEQKIRKIDTMEMDLFDVKEAKKMLQAELEEKTDQYNLLNTEHTFLSGLCKEQGIKIPKLESELEDIKRRFTEASINLTDMTEKANTLDTDLKIMTIELTTANSQIEMMTNENHDLKSSVARLNQELAARERDLEALRVKLFEEKEIEIAQRVAQESIDKDNCIIEKGKEIEGLKEEILRIQEANEQNTQNIKSLFEAHKLQMAERMAELEDDIRNKQARLNKAKQELDDKSAVIQAHLNTITARDQTIKALEMDLADLFQKMVQCDRQIRGEMTEQFAKERFDLETQLTEQHRLEIDSLKNNLENAQIAALSNQQTKLRAAFQEDLVQIHGSYRIKIAGFTEELQEKEITINDLKTEIKNYERKISAMYQEFNETRAEMNKEFDEKLEQTKQEHLEMLNQSMELERQKYEQLLIEEQQRSQNQLNEATNNHKKQVEDLRNFHSISTANAKKEMETLKNIEIGKLNTTHENIILMLNVKHEGILKAEIARVTDEKDREISDLIDDYDRATAELKKDLGDTKTKLETANGIISNLRDELSETEKELAEKKKFIHEKDKEFRQKSKDYELQLAKQVVDHEKRLKNERDNLKADHINEMQIMLQEFEKAKNFLKKEITTLRKQLEDAAIKYINREPRDIDVITIRDLEADVKQQRKALDELNRELENYRLEMNNREISFNKIFNNAPMVGLMQPLQKSPKNVRKEKPVIINKLPPLLPRAGSASTIG